MKGRYLLYADDDADDQDIIRELMSQIDPDLDVVCVENGSKAIEFLENLSEGANYPCLIVLDLNMPQLNGLDTLQSLKEHHAYSDIPVVMYTTSDDNREKDQARASGAKDFITKPIRASALRAVTERFVSLCEMTVPCFREAG